MLMQVHVLLECDRPLTPQSLSRISRLKERDLNDPSALARVRELREVAQFGEQIEKPDPNEAIQLRAQVDQMDFEHEIVLQISQQLGIDRNLPLPVIDRLQAIRTHLEKSQSEVVPRLVKKLEPMSNHRIERDNYIRKLESQLRETNSQMQTDFSALQEKLSSQEGFIQKVREQLKLDNGEYSGILSELVEVEKARKLGSIAHGRLKQIILTIATWIQQFQNVTLDQLSRELVEWYGASDPVIDVHQIVCQVIDLICDLKPLK
jgi:hypothetical protein